MKFTDLNCNINEEVKIIEFNGKEIEVKQYLPSSEKDDIISAIFQNADAGTIVDTLAEEALFNIYLVFEYTNIEFTDEEKQENLFELYDKFLCSGLLDAVIAAIPKEEYDSLFNHIEQIHKEYLGYRDSARAVFEQMSIFAPQTAADLSEKVQNFDINKFQEITNVAGALGINNN